MTMQLCGESTHKVTQAGTRMRMTAGDTVLIVSESKFAGNLQDANYKFKLQ